MLALGRKTGASGGETASIFVDINSPLLREKYPELFLHKAGEKRITISCHQHYCVVYFARHWPFPTEEGSGIHSFSDAQHSLLPRALKHRSLVYAVRGFLTSFAVHLPCTTCLGSKWQAGLACLRWLGLQ